MRREYKLAPTGGETDDGLDVMEVLEITENGQRSAIVTVDERYAVDVLEAIRRAYQDGREDNAPHWHSATGYDDTPCWCPSPLTYAPQGDGTYGSSEEQ